MEKIFRYAYNTRNTAKKTLAFTKKTIPSGSWMKYAAVRLGTFIMTYAATVGLAVLLFAMAGIMLSFGAIIALIPFAIFIAIRVSGALTEEKKP